MYKSIHLCLLLCFTLALSACSLWDKWFHTGTTPTAIPPVNHKNPDFAFKPPMKKDRLVVFVHGIYGDAWDTWKSPTNTHFWDLLRADSMFSDADVFVYGFPSSFFGVGAFSINDAAASLDQYMRDKINDYQEILFICHSMGGLVVEEYLLQNPQVAQKTPLVFFYSTPQEGSGITTIAQFVSHNPGIETMLPGDKNQYLTGLDQRWKSAKVNQQFQTLIYCAFERNKTYDTVLVVDYYSGTRLCEGVSAPIPADHIGIVKPSQADDRAYVAFQNAYRQVILDPLMSSIKKAQQLVNRTYTGSVRLKHKSQYVGLDYAMTNTPSDWRVRAGSHGQLQGLWVCDNASRCWQAPNTRGRLVFWNTDCQARGNPQDWELFVVEPVNPQRGTIRLRQIYGDYVHIAGNTLEAFGGPENATIFTVE